MTEYLFWLLTVEALGLAALPLCAFFFRALPDRGYGLSKALGILLVAFVNWWLGSVAGLGNYPVVLWLLAVALAAGGLGLYRLRLAKVPAERRSLALTVAIEEAVFLAAFLFWTYVRSRNPDIYSTEKPMDFMLLQVNSYAHSFPPPDAWLSGHTVNYYYLGYNIFAMIGRMAGVDPRFGFNLANISIISLGSIGAYSLTLALVRNRLWALGGVFAMLFAGNLDALRQVISQLQNGGINLSGLNLFCSTRIIDGGCTDYKTITEIPIFSMLWNDLHPHVMAVPFALLAIAVGFAALLDREEHAYAGAAFYLRLVMSAIILGALFPINSWDYPTYLLLGLACLFVAAYRHDALTARTGWSIAAVLPASLLAYLPYYITVHLNGQGVGFLTHPSNLGEVFIVLGTFLVPVLLFAAWRFADVLIERDAEPKYRTMPPLSWLRELPTGAGWWLLVAAIFGVFALPWRTDLLLLLIVVMACWTIWLRLRDGAPELLLALGLITGGALLLLLGDFVYLRDIFDSGPNYRMNTVFKLYYQSWLLLSVATIFAIATISRTLMVSHRSLLPAWSVAVIVAALVMALYPLEGVNSQGNSRASTPGLDGLAYLTMSDPGDAVALNWIRAHTAPDAVIAEAGGTDLQDPNNASCKEYWVCAAPYTYDRVSALTGRPTVIGWPGSHESLWRGTSAAAELQQRENDIRTLYTTTDTQAAVAIIRRYHIDYVYVGALERATYGAGPNVPTQSLLKFDQFLQGQQISSDVTLYTVPAQVHG